MVAGASGDMTTDRVPSPKSLDMQVGWSLLLTICSGLAGNSLFSARQDSQTFCLLCAQLGPQRQRDLQRTSTRVAKSTGPIPA